MQPIEPSSVSAQNIGTSLFSLFSTSAHDVLKNQHINAELPAKKQPEKHRFGLSRVKNATKCAAKKFNQMFSKAKLRLIKPTLKYSGDISIMSSTTQMTDMDSSYEFEEVDINDISRFSSRSTVMIDEPDQSHTEGNRLSNSSLDLSIRSSVASSASNISLNESSLMHQIFAQSLADLNMICAQNETPVPAAVEVKKPFRKGTPYKLKMPQRLTLYEENVSLSKFDGSDSNESVSQPNNAQNTFDVDAVDFRAKNQLEKVSTEMCIEDETELPVKERFKSHFDPGTKKASIAKRIARAYRDFYTKFVSQPIKYEILRPKTHQEQLHPKKESHNALTFLSVRI